MTWVPRQERKAHALATTLALLYTMVLAASAGPSAAQDVIALPAENRPLAADFEEIYRLGSVDGDGWDTFGNIGGTGFNRAGNLYILDTQAVRTYVVDVQGTLLRQFIEEGEGPGEFGSNTSAALELAVMRDGRVAIYDVGRRGFALFSANGEFERTIPLGGGQEGHPLFSGIQPIPGTDRILSTTEVTYLGGPEPGPEDAAQAPSVRYVLSFNLDGDEVGIDSVAAGWKPPGDPDGYKPRLSAGALPSGAIVYSDSTSYAIKYAEPGGSVTRILTRPFLPEPVTRRLRDAEIERQLERLGDGGGNPLRQRMIEFRRGQIEAMEFYTEVPVILDLKTSWEGTLWVLHRGSAGTEARLIDLISADGRYLGTFPHGSTTLPAAFGPYGLVAFVGTGDEGAPYVQVARLPEGIR